MPLALKITIAVTIILSASWLSGKRPELAGFLTALPLVSILALAFSYTDHGSLALSSKYARSIILAVPVSWLFFVPFFLPNAFTYRSGKRGVWGYCCWRVVISCIRLFCVGWLRFFLTSLRLEKNRIASLL